MLNKILVCLDGTSFAERVLPYAIERATHFHSKIVLLKILVVNLGAYPAMAPMQGGMGSTLAIAKYIDAGERKDAAYLTRISSKLKALGLDIETVQLTRYAGDPLGGEIAKYAEKINADMVMLASHAYKGWKKFFHGDIAESLIRQARFPVFVIGPDDTRQLDDFLREFEPVAV
jgi:nucleotide-binding universal stress UspA family protein